MRTSTALAALLFTATASAQVQPHGGMLRFPDVSATQIVFVYADDLWLVPRDGGVAAPLASPPGTEAFPRFSPDGKTIAFVGNYDGNRDLYTIPIAGGVPTRVTYHPGVETLSDWTPDGKLMFFTNGLAGRDRQVQLFTVSPQGGLPEKLPGPYGAFGAISPSGEWLAYTPHTADNRTWKRYRGGMATDIWLFHLKNHSARRVTDWEGTDSLPMWQKDKVYYLSDEGASHRLNIWMYDPATDKRRQVTTYADYDVKWPSIGPGSKGDGEIVFQHGSELVLLDLATAKPKKVDVTIPGARPTLRPRAVDASKYIQSWSISPTGKRAVVSARGDVWTAPAKHGSPRNLTRTSGANERSASWSPDGKWIAYFSDATGEYELYMASADGHGEGVAGPKRLTNDGHAFRTNPTWSPDSKRIAFCDKTGTLYLHTIQTGETKVVEKDPWAGDLLGEPSFSHDSRWLAYSRADEASSLDTVWLYEIETGANHQVTSGMFPDSSPVFDRKGDYLYYKSRRTFRPLYGEIDTSFLYAGTETLLAVPLRADQKSPLAPKSDEEDGKAKKDDKDDKKDDAKDAKKEDKKDEAKKDDEKKDEDKKDGDKKDEEKPREKVEIALEGFERRAIPVPVPPGVFGKLAVNDKGALVYVRGSIQGIESPSSIRIVDLSEDEPKEKTVSENAGGFEISADGKKLLVLKDGGASIVDAAKGGPKASADDEDAADEDGGKGGKVVTEGMTAWIDPRAEWNELFTDAWRLERDFFYDPNMHKVDWQKVRKDYEAMLPDCNTRADVAYVIREMISELNVGHAYYSGGDFGDEPRMNVGLLGCDFALDHGAYKIARIQEGASWDSDARGPLSQPGVDVKAGDYLLAVNGAPVDPAKDPWAGFLGLANKTIRLTVSAKPTPDADARDVLVKALDSETDLRYRAWIEEHRAYVEKKTGGKVGYVYVPSTGVDGQNDLVRQFEGQRTKDALIIDERWNSGGQIPTRFIELLNRPITNYWARRDAKDWTWPPDAHAGPQCMLINGLSGSGGDAFPAYFKLMKLGKTIGTRTWGGLVGLSGNPALIDGAEVTVPTFGYYKTNGTWGIEGHGVDPDMEVIDDPSKMVDGGDPQLDAAIELMLSEIQSHPYVAPKRPAYPDRSGMGVLDADK
ncbi:MAG TPA: PDZ domain-containing protein [Planctomycetota bacterium]|nr:PDZ domain-containing protein [Planctomycetota bacterium]